jgi:hypothetical protein
MLTAAPQQDVRHLDHPQVVRCLLLVAHQDRPTLRKPAQRALDDPPPRRVARLAGLVECLLADPSDVVDVVSPFHQLPCRPVVHSPCPNTGSGGFLGRLGMARPLPQPAWLQAARRGARSLLAPPRAVLLRRPRPAGSSLGQVDGEVGFGAEGALC